jgi:hypothetical protein
MQLGISSFKSGAVLSSLSTIISLGISSINYAPGVSSLSTAISLGLSSIVDYGYIPFQTIDVPNAIANNYTPKTVSSLLALLSTSFSTMNDIQGVSSVSSLLAYGVSSISGGPGLSTLSTTISMGLSSITVKMIFPTVWSSQSTFVGTGLTLQDISINPSQPLNVTVGATLQLNGNPYPQALSYINSSTISTSVMQIKGSLYVSSITASSIQISSLFQTNSISTSYLRASTLSFSETFFTDTQYLYSYNASLYLNGASLYNSTDGISSLSSVVGYGAQSIVGLGISSMSTTISYGLSTVNVVPGLSSLYSTLFSYYYPNFSSLSTLNAFTNNVTLYSVTAGFLSTNLISTINYSSLNVYTSSLNVGSAYISSLSTPSIFATNFSGDTIFASTFYTSTLTASTIYISSFYIQVANFSTVSVATMYVSSMKFPGNSTLWASSGSLMLNSFKLPTDPYPGLNPTYSNFSIPVTYLSTLYAQNVFVTTPSISTFASSNTVVNGFVSSGIFSTTIQKVIVRNNNTWQSWNLAGVGIFDSNIANTTTSLSSLYIGYDPQSYSRSNFTDTNYRNPVGLGFSTLNTATIWDGYKLITCGNETTTPVQSGIYVYIPPLYWNNMHPSNVTTNPYAWNKITASIGTAGYPGGPGSGNIGSNIGDIEFNGSMYVIVLNLNTADDHGYVRWSLDGINYYPNFNSISLSPSYANPLSLMKSVAWNGSYWIMGWSGNTNIDTASLIQLSKDGKNWATSNNNFNTNYNGTGLNYPGHVTKIVWNGTVWTAAWAYDSNAGTYPAIVSNLRYSYDGINWSNCVWGGNSFSGSWASGKGYFTELIVTQNFVEASYFSGNYGSPGVTTNNTYRSYDGINFTTNADPGFPNYGWMAPYYDGNKLGHSLIAGMIPNTSPYWGISTNIYTSLLTNSTFTNLAFQNQMLTDTQGIPAVKRVAVRSNVIPSLSMSNLNIYGSTFHNVYDPVNTIVGFANTAIFPGGTIDWLERQNYLKFNNTLNIVSYVSTQVIIDTPGNPNTTYRNVNNFGRATLDVLCTVNAQNFWARNLNLSPSQLWTTSTFGSNQYAFYSPYSTFAQTLALGSSSNILNILSTPLFTLDIYHNKNYSIIREPTFTPLNSIAASNAIKYLLPQDNTALYPLVSGSDGTLSYFWRGQNATYYKFIDSPGTTYFTGQHPTNCLDINTETASNYIGQIVSIAGQGYTAYDLSGNQVTGKSAILITNATPITKLTTRDMDPTVFGVVTDRFNGSIDASGNFATYTNSGFETQLFGRIMVNSLGEGAIWVTNYNGNISNGDYICSSPIPGLSRKQDNNRLWNYTIAKATQSCDFNPQFISTMTLSTYGDMTISTFVSCMSYKCEPIEFNGSTFMKAFIGCTYHCA